LLANVLQAIGRCVGIEPSYADGLESDFEITNGRVEVHGGRASALQDFVDMGGQFLGLLAGGWLTFQKPRQIGRELLNGDGRWLVRLLLQRSDVGSDLPSEFRRRAGFLRQSAKVARQFRYRLSDSWQAQENRSKKQSE